MLRPDTYRMGIDRQRRAEVRGNEVSRQSMVAVANRHSCADNKIWRRSNGMNDERKVLLAFGIIVALAGIVMAAALVMNAVVG